MTPLYFKKSYEFENPSRRLLMAGPELFGGSGEAAKKVGEWVNERGESTEQARALAERVAKQKEEIESGAQENLLKLYVDVFTEHLSSKENYNIAEFTVEGKSYEKKGILGALEMNSPLLKTAFAEVPDLRLLAYATVYKNFKEQNLDANFMPMGAKVKVENGTVTMSYQKDGVTKTASSELFPWSTYEQARGKYAELMQKKAEAEAAKIAAEGVPEIELGDGLSIPAEPAAGETEATPSEVPSELPVPPEGASQTPPAEEQPGAPAEEEPSPESIPEPVSGTVEVREGIQAALAAAKEVDEAGNAQSALRSYKEVQKIDPTNEEVKAEINRLQREFGRVSLTGRTPENSNWSFVLNDEVPSSKMERYRDFALSQLKNAGHFEGLMPLGSYSIMMPGYKLTPRFKVRDRLPSKVEW